jgi:hypothetical protein
VVDFRSVVRRQQGRAYLMTQSRDPQWRPADSMIEAYYNDHIASFDVDKPLVVQHIIAPDSVSASFIRDQAIAGIDFLDLAEEFYPGEPSVRRALADLGAIGPGDVSPEFYETARLTSVGGFSQPVKTEYGWHIIKVIERREPKTLAQARSEIVAALKKQHERQVFADFRDRLYDAYHAQVTGRLYPVYLRPRGERVEPGGET